MQAAMQIQITKKTKVEQYFELLYGEHMARFPKKRNRKKGRVSPYKYDKQRPWVFIGEAEAMKPAATFATLYNYLWDPRRKNTYYSPNSFYRNDARRAEYARWIHAFQLDIDVKNDYIQNSGMSILDVLDKIHESGLPRPTAIVRSPSGGYQPIWILSKAVRATPKTRILYSAIQKHMAEDINADDNAIGVERVFRTPTEENIVFFEPKNVYDFQTFIDWRDINHPFDRKALRILVNQYDIMGHPAVRKLYNQDAVIGKRELSCVTLTLCMKFSGWPLARAEQEIEKWWHECVEKGGTKPFRLRDALYRVRRLYRIARYHAPSQEYIYHLTGMHFSYKGLYFFTAAKPREERVRTHRHEWKEDLLRYLKQNNNELQGTLNEISDLLGMPKSSLKLVLKELEEENLISVHTTRGRYGSTRVTLIDCGVSQNGHQQENDDRSNIVQFVTNELDAAYQEVAASEESLEIQRKQKKSHSDNTIGEEVGGGPQAAPTSGSVIDLLAYRRKKGLTDTS